ncbi:hypothetical protein GPECTOR_20g567 [Gonium pectorale]|uniref:Small ribosomal subunit protein uS9c n=1 Tax=Gonium pectorale TaxID=33097 RepID=A0A150GJQ4_GONPE|nr:hypothetical protein GPECTOR_20g567 [Gonium pectorale]|eukprot:KXZ49710.1 hypothetical protein GPECTOR_20g567 [Gonium pectorale]
MIPCMLAGRSAISSAVPSATALRSLGALLSHADQSLGYAKVANDRAAATAAPLPSSSASSDADLPLQFSLRPSVLSPIFATWDQARQSAARKEHLLALLRANVQLANHLPTPKPGTLIRTVRARRDALRKVSALLKRTELEEPRLAALASCPRPEAAATYCAALEEAARAADPAARDFAAMQRGETSPWTYFAQHFHERYRNTPRLQPLEVIFSKPDPDVLFQQLRASAAAAAAALPGERAHAGGAGGAAAGGPHIDLAGVTHAAGKRKASSAELRLVPGNGTITVNGLPFAEYFRDDSARRAVLEPLAAAGTEGRYDIAVRVRGGGLLGQAGAVRTALARALCVQRPGLAGRLEDMTRWDGRVVERKKPAREKAKRGYTWVKR